jgi:hypothetical protein
VRSRRLTLVFQYQKARSLRLNVEYKKTNFRLTKQVELLGKELVKLDDLYNRCKARLSQITVLKNEADFVGALMEEDDED